MKLIIVVRGPICAGKSTLVNALRGRIDEVSIIDPDSYKRQIDYTKSSDWRRQLSYEVSFFLAEKLMELGRSIVIDIHASEKAEFDKLKSLAISHKYRFISIFLYPPLKVCLARNALRPIEGVDYSIPQDKVEQLYQRSFFDKVDITCDTSTQSPEVIAGLVCAEAGINTQNRL